jgi:hypothetical protein
MLARTVTAGFVVLLLAGCSADPFPRRLAGPQVVPQDYKADLLGLMRTYLTDPTGVREAGISEPALRRVRGRDLYVSCVRYNAKDATGRYQGMAAKPVVFLDGRVDTILDTPEDGCGNATYAPFPELERLAR